MNVISPLALAKSLGAFVFSSPLTLRKDGVSLRMERNSQISKQIQIISQNSSYMRLTFVC